jgi:hypothetical protein
MTLIYFCHLVFSDDCKVQSFIMTMRCSCSLECLYRIRTECVHAILRNGDGKRLLLWLDGSCIHDSTKKSHCDLMVIIRCRGVYWFHHVCLFVVCRQILCRTITWAVFLRMFWNFISSLPVKRGGSLSFLTIFTFAVPELLDLIWRKIGFLPYERRGGSLSFLVGTISNVLIIEIGWTDVGSFMIPQKRATVIGW